MTTLPATVTDDDRLIAMWLHGRPARTQAHYASIAADFRSVVTMPIQAVGLAHIQAYAAGLERLAPATQANRLSTVKSLFTFAQKVGYITLNPAVAIQMPRIKNTLAERIICEDDVLRMIELETDIRNRTILRLLYIAGLRREELRTLRVRDMRKHGKGGKITVFGKGGKTRTIPLPAKMWSELCEIAPEDRDAPLFSTPHGALSASTVWRIVKRAAKKAGLPDSVTTHGLRHSHASHSLDHGCPVHVLQSVLGHASLVTTSKYVHVNSSESSADYLSD